MIKDRWLILIAYIGTVLLILTLPVALVCAIVCAATQAICEAHHRLSIVVTGAVRLRSRAGAGGQ